MIEVLNAFREAGADCLFAPGVRDPETIKAITAAVTGPVNILAAAGSPSVDEMRRLGCKAGSVLRPDARLHGIDTAHRRGTAQRRHIWPDD